MEDYMPIFSFIMVVTEFIAAATAVIYFKSLKNIAWKVFAIYLIVILLQELYFSFNKDVFFLKKAVYYNYIVFSLEFLFFYWLIAYNSLKNRNLFFLFTIIYLVSIPFQELFDIKGPVKTLNYTVGTVLLSFLLVLEFFKQIKSDEILFFKENKMFFITIGLIMGYIGSFTFFAFNRVLYDNYKHLWDIFYVIFMIVNYLMYLLFAASFIWGKRQS